MWKDGRRSKEDTWCWNEEMNEAVSRKKERKKHIKQCVRTVLRRIREVMKAASNAMREMVVEALTELQNSPNLMLTLVIGLKTDSKEVEGGRYMNGSGGRLCFSEKERGKV